MENELNVGIDLSNASVKEIVGYLSDRVIIGHGDYVYNDVEEQLTEGKEVGYMIVKCEFDEDSFEGKYMSNVMHIGTTVYYFVLMNSDEPIYEMKGLKSYKGRPVYHNIVDLENIFNLTEDNKVSTEGIFSEYRVTKQEL